MRRRFFHRTYPALILLILLAVNRLAAQMPWNENLQDESFRLRMNRVLSYETVFLPGADPDSVEMHLYTKVSNDYLQFVLDDSGYVAGYEVTLALKDASESAVAGLIQRNEIAADTYEETNDRTLSTREHFRFTLPPGEYALFIELVDRESKKNFRTEETVTFPRYHTEEIHTTTLLFTDTPTFDMEIFQQLFPIFPAVRSLTDTVFAAAFFILSDGSARDARLTWSIKNHDKQVIDEQTQDIVLSDVLTPVRIDLGQPLPFGRYGLAVDIVSNEEKKHLETSFIVRWSSHSVLMTDLNQAVETLQYLMPRDEWTTLNALPEDEQKEMIETFWKERDPNPETPENELEEEFFLRVAFANENFFTWPDGRNGWRSDRGRIYIIYGPPTTVERPASEGSNRYEIWTYRHLQRRFVFLDRLGSGDFRLISE